jgi:alpha-L-fucosidase
MDRRTFLASSLRLGMALPLLRPSEMFAGTRPSALARPSAGQLAWQDLELGMFIHFAPNTWQDEEYDRRTTPLAAINPAINTDQWADCAVALGAKYVVFVAKHAGGFCMWQTETTDYGIRNTPWRGGHGDVMADLSASCRRRGLKLGVYLSPIDSRFGAGNGGRCRTPEQQAAYDAVYRRQLTELLSRYGELVEVWFDGSIAIPVGDIVQRYAPHAMIFQGPHATIRWVGNEDGFAPYPAWNGVSRADKATGIATAIHGDPNGSAWLPNEVDVSIRRPNWFWSTKNESKLLSLDALLEIYYRSVGRGAQLLLNIPPDRRGLIPEADFTRAREFGAQIARRFGRSLAETSGSGESLTLRLPPPRPTVDHVILQEDCRQGERVRAYRLEGRTADGWRTLGKGSAIGHKRIQPISLGTFDALRLVVTASAAPPVLRRFAAFHAGSPPEKWNAS